jgi:hypothetical protein
MKKVLTALLASAALVAAVPAVASAHEENDGYYRGSDWDTDSAGYDSFRQEFQHLYDGVQHGLSDGSYDRREAQQFYWAIRSLQRRLDYYRDSHGYLNPWERQDLQRRLTSLHDQMHIAHVEGHEPMRDGYYGGYGRPGGFGGYGYR